MSVNEQHSVAEEPIIPTTDELGQLCYSLKLCYELRAFGYKTFAHMRTLPVIDLFEAASQALLASASEDVRLAEEQFKKLWPTWSDDTSGLLANLPHDSAELRTLIQYYFRGSQEVRGRLAAAAVRLVDKQWQFDRFQKLVKHTWREFDRKERRQPGEISVRELEELCISLVLCYELVSSNYAPFANMSRRPIIDLFEAASQALLTVASETVWLAEEQCDAWWPMWREDLHLAPSARWPDDDRELLGLVQRFEGMRRTDVIALYAAAQKQFNRLQVIVWLMRLAFGLR
jgi:cytochrome c556